MSYSPRPEDAAFVLLDVLRAPELLGEMPEMAESADTALLQQVLEEMGNFVGGVIAPLNAVGDAVGCQFVDGKVVMPPGFSEAYQSFWQAGWPALAAATEDGGQGLPRVLEVVLYEWLRAANHAWTMAPGLLHGAYECIKHHASQAVQDFCLSQLATGEWLPTMCLTEAHAGSDLGLVRTQAQPVDAAQCCTALPGEHRISGTKIFISSGDHDLSANIIHLVLARLPGAPAGPKGLSLFVVPKFLPDGQGGLGERNAVECERLEEKMGLHGSATCVMRFDEATGWLVGAPGAGLGAMFIMMNAARLEVALEGVGLLDSAWQIADRYAHERRQMRAPGTAPASRGATDVADLLVEHPAMRRILDVQRAWIDGGRVLGYRTGLLLDVARLHPDAERRAQAQRWCSVITPVLKAAWTQQGFDGASACLQVLGGHGYMREWGIEQIVRDARVPMIYEGTNEIQAIDLLLRKVLPDSGAALEGVLDELQTLLQPGRTEDDDALSAFAAVRALVAEVHHASASDAGLPYRVADDFLRAVAVALLAWAWATLLATPTAQTERWLRPGAAFRQRVLPELAWRAALVRAQIV